MKIRNYSKCYTLLPELKACLKEIRVSRNFNAELYLKSKISLLNDYLNFSHLKACVVAISGGIDSAVVLGILTHAFKQVGSPIQKIYPVLMPIFRTQGATNQEQALEKGNQVCNHFGVAPIILNLSDEHALMKQAVDQAINISGHPWAAGQLTSYIRTPALYYLISLLYQEELPAIICGTTNRDEGGYLGFFGKAADGMVDIQLISDLHKSEVIELAKLLNIPRTIIEATPSGDLFDGRTDEEVFGAPYDFVELYQNYLGWKENKKKTFRLHWPVNACQQFDVFAHNLETIHHYNRHKYLGRSPAIHLDILASAVPEGWCNYPIAKKHTLPEKPPVAKFELSSSCMEHLARLSPPHPSFRFYPEMGQAGLYVDALLSVAECETLLLEMTKQQWKKANVNGYQMVSDDSAIVGSYRATTYHPELAEMIWNRLAPFFPSIRMIDETVATDAENKGIWRPTGVNPMLRFIRYEEGGLVLPHYDSSYIQNEFKRTLSSVVIYLSDSSGFSEEKEGSTRFIRPHSHNSAYDDWNEPAKEEDVLLSIKPKQGSAICFDHRLLHDSQAMISPKPKMIIRTDIFYERCDWYRFI